MQDRTKRPTIENSNAANAAEPVETNTHLSSSSPVFSSTSRRRFLKTASIGAAALTASAMVPAVLGEKAGAVEIGPPVSGPHQRGNDLEKIRKAAAKNARQAVIDALPHPTNGDEERYADQAFAGNFSKTLPHDANGLVVPSAYQALLAALSAGTQQAFAAVPSGGGGRLAGPLSPLQFQMEGADSPTPGSQFIPPSVASAGGAAEMVELFWEAYLRDVPFINYGSNPLVGQAVVDMNHLSGYGGPKPVTAQNLFRYPFIGCTDGPYVSQILYQTHRLDGVDFVPMAHSRLQVADPNTGQVLTGPGTGVDFMTNLPEYVFTEDGNGALQPNPNVIDPTPRFIRGVRDLGSLAASDSIFSLYFRAAIILGGLGIGIDRNSPYTNDNRINGFNT